MWMWRRERSFVDEETDEGKSGFASGPEPESGFGFGKKEKNVGRAC